MKPHLHLVCGKVAAGKSTLCRSLAQGAHTVLVSEDDWLAALYPDELATLRDYARCAARLETAIGPHIRALLSAGMSVVMDFQANTVARRNSLAALAWESDAQVTLHVLETSDAQCLDRLKARNAAGNHPFQVSEAQFHALAQYYEHPTTDEGLPIATYRS